MNRLYTTAYKYTVDYVYMSGLYIHLTIFLRRNDKRVLVLRGRCFGVLGKIETAGRWESHAHGMAISPQPHNLDSERGILPLPHFCGISELVISKSKLSGLCR